MDENLLAQLLNHLSLTDDGKQGILTMRKTSKRVRDYIDQNVPQIVIANQTKPLIASIKPNGNPGMSELDYFKSVNHKIKEMLDCPPPASVTGLLMDCYFPPQLSTAQDADNWARFLLLWRPKITFLSVKNLVLPLTSTESAFLSSKTIKTLAIQNISKDDFRIDRNLLTSLPLATNTVREIYLTGEQHGFNMKRFLSCVKANAVIKVLQVNVSNSAEIIAMEKLLVHKESDVKFTLLLGIHLSIYFPLPKNVKRFSDTIIKSNCNVNLVGINSRSLEWLCKDQNWEGRSRLKEKVLTLTSWEQNPEINLDDFPRLRFIGEINFNSWKDYEYLPNSITTIRIRCGPELNHLFELFPASLTVLQLEFKEFHVSMNYVAKLVSEVYFTCNNLERLGVHLLSLLPQANGTIPRVDPPPQKIKSLQVLTFKASPSLRRTLLIDILHVHSMKYCSSLEISAGILLDGVTFETELQTMDMIAEGEISGSLKKVTILYTDNARQFKIVADEAYRPLKEVATRNCFEKGHHVIPSCKTTHIGQYCPALEHMPDASPFYGLPRFFPLW